MAGDIMKLSYTVKQNDSYINVLDVLKNEFLLSARLITKLKQSNNIFFNEEITYTKKLVYANDVVSVLIDFVEDNSNIVATNIPLDIIYEDEYLLAINKPANMPVHPSMLHYEETLSNAVKYYFDTLNLKRKIRIVNRLDKDTSGIVIFKKRIFSYCYRLSSKKI